MSDPIPEAYKWLADELRPHCDKVITREFDYGNSLGIGVQWGERVKVRRALLVEHEGRIGINDQIRMGLTDRKSVVNSLLYIAPIL